MGTDAFSALKAALEKSPYYGSSPLTPPAPLFQALTLERIEAGGFMILEPAHEPGETRILFASTTLDEALNYVKLQFQAGRA